MNAPAAMTAPKAGLFGSRLFRPAAKPSAMTVVDGVKAAQAALWAEAGEFLTRHALAPSPDNYAAVHGYLTGDVTMGRVVGNALAAGQPIAAALEAARAGQDAAQERRSDTLDGVAKKLEGRLAECLAILARSLTSNATYGAALDREVAAAGNDPGGTIDRLIRLSRDMAEATRAVGGELDDTRRETERLRADLQSARRAADRDHLTGLPNRRSFDAELARKTTRGDGSGPAVVALCDIDDFKLVNDQHGHDTGDRVLRFFARLLRSELGTHALVARHGGEEFACLFHDMAPAEAAAALDDIRDRLRTKTLRSRTSGESIGNLTFSAGLATVDASAANTMRRADRALYSAKRSGKDRVEISPD